MVLDTKEEATPEGKEADSVSDSGINQPESDDSRESINALEQNANGPSGNSDANEDIFGYLKNRGLMSDEPPAKKKNWFSRHKGAVAGGGSVIILLGGFFTLAAPLKLQGIIEAVTGTGMGRIEGYIEKRTQKIVFQAIFHNIGVEDRNLVKGGSLISRIAKTMTTNKFEERLAKKGITFVANKEGGKVVSVSIRLIGDNTDEAKKLLKKAFKNADDLEAALAEAPVTRKIMKSIIKEDLGVWGFLVRGKMTRWMMSYLGVKRFGTAKTNDAATPEEKMKTAALDDVADSLDSQGRAIDQATDVMGTAERQLSNEAGEVASDSAKAASKTSVREALTETADVARTTIRETTSGAITKVVLEIGTKLGLNVSETVAKKIGTKAIPVYGWVVAGATAVVFAHWAYKNVENGKVARAIATPAAILMGSIYSKWGGIATQAKLGTLDTDLINYYAPFLDGVETSSGWNCIDKNWQTDCDKTGEPLYKKLNETNPEAVKVMLDIMGGNTLLNFWNGWQFGWDFSPNYLLARLIYNIDDAIMGLAMDAIIGQIQGAFNVASTVAKIGLGEKAVEDINANVEQILGGMAQFAMQTMLNVFGLNVSMLSGGNQLLDILLNGSVYAGNRYAETSLGLHEIDSKTGSLQLQRYIAEQTEYDKSQGALYALFSPDARNSVTSRLISRTSFGGGMAATASNAVASLFGLVKSTPSSLADIVTNKTSAASFTSPEAVLNAVSIGMTDAELNAPVNPKVSSGETCATIDAGDTVASWFGIDTTEYEGFDNCKIDSTVAESILCSMDESIRETAQCNPDAGGASIATATGSCANGNIIDKITRGWDRSGNQKSITLCAIPGTDMSTMPHWSDPRYEGTSASSITEIAVNSEAAKSLATIVEQAGKDGVKLSASVGYRSLYEQCSIVMKPGNLGKRPSVCPGWITAIPGNWTSTAVYSNHMMGYSIDFYDQSEKWMRACVHDNTSTYKNATDGEANNRCYGFWDDVYQKQGWDGAHFTYDP